MLTLCALLPFYSCGSDNTASGNADTSGTTENAPTEGAVTDDAAGANSQNLPVGTLQSPATQPATAPATGSAPPSGVKHYTCPKNCKGSGGDAAGTCPVCGTAYVHNQAFHGQAPAGATPPTPGTPGANAATPVTTPPPPSPEKNAAGVYHYTCAKGCAGGAASAGKCAKCGGDLAHNAAYHQ